MTAMHKLMSTALLLVLLATATVALGQQDKDTEPTSWIYFNVIKDDNGKPVRNAAVILHAVNAKGKQERGDMELKTDPEGKTNFDGVPYGMLRVQVIASGFQTYGEDYDISKDKTEITIKLKRPRGQYSVYDDHPKDTNAPPKQDAPAADKKPN
jgi:Carboxypeptidase regulatory-like domain